MYVKMKVGIYQMKKIYFAYKNDLFISRQKYDTKWVNSSNFKTKF